MLTNIQWTPRETNQPALEDSYKSATTGRAADMMMSLEGAGTSAAGSR
ncbi:MAG: hypothetical protein AB1Z29_16470 [Desulfobacterales bacterium]